MGSQVVAIIPARYESTRLPGKPLALIDGKPMIQHVYERTRAVALRRSRAGRDRRRAHRRRGARLRRRRGDDRAAIIASGTDRIAEVARDARRRDRSSTCRAICRFSTPAMVGAAVALLRADAALPMATVKTPIRESRGDDESERRQGGHRPRRLRAATSRAARCRTGATARRRRRARATSTSGCMSTGATFC